MAREFLENIGKTISMATGAAVDKTEDFFAVTKIKGKMATEERMIEQICKNIGREIYKEYVQGMAVSDAVAEMCRDIERHEGEIQALGRDLALFRKKDVEKETACEVAEEPAVAEDVKAEEPENLEEVKEELFEAEEQA